MFISRSHLSNRAAVKALTGGFGLLGWAPCSLEKIRQLSDELLLLCTVHTEQEGEAVLSETSENVYQIPWSHTQREDNHHSIHHQAHSIIII